jgi:hypothetical protein
MFVAVLVLDGHHEVAVAPSAAHVLRRAGPCAFQAEGIPLTKTTPCRQQSPKSYWYSKRNCLPLLGRMSLNLVVVESP